MGTKSWEWEGMCTRKLFPHISKIGLTSSNRLNSGHTGAHGIDHR